MSGRMWEAVETKTGKVGMAKTKGRKEERGSRKEMRGEGTEERKVKTKERKKDESKEGSRIMGDLGWRRGKGKVRSRDEETGTREISQVNLHFWQKSQWTNAHKEALRLCNRHEGRVCAEEEEGVFVVKRRKRRGIWVHFRTIEERVY